MQLIPRYVIPNRVTIVTDQIGFVTEFRPVYSRTITLYRGIDNTIQFRLLNADQKPVDVTGYIPQFIAFNENSGVVIKHEGDIIDDSSNSSRGLFSVTITEQELLELSQQYLRYNIYLVDSFGNKTLSYSHSNFDNDATIFVSDGAFPFPRDSETVSNFQLESRKSDTWISEMAQVFPTNNMDSRLISIAVYSSDFIGDVTVQGTLDNTTIDANWADLDVIKIDDCETEPDFINVSGAFKFLRFKTTTDPNNIQKIVIRS